MARLAKLINMPLLQELANIVSGRLATTLFLVPVPRAVLITEFPLQPSGFVFQLPVLDA